MKIVSIPYQFVKIRSTDDWLSYDDPTEDQGQGSKFTEQLLSEDEIRVLNSDFNYKHYGVFYEKIDRANGKRRDDEEESEANKEEDELTDRKKEQEVGFAKIISKDNLLNQMWNRVQLDEGFEDNYE